MAKKRSKNIKNTDQDKLLSAKKNFASPINLKYIIIITVASLAVFSNTLFMDFVWDDVPLIKENILIHDITNIPQLFSTDVFYGLRKEAEVEYYRPIFTTTLALDYFVWKENPFGYHFTNLILHIIACLLVYVISLKLINDEKSSLLASLIFSLHPIHVEAVTWISGRTDVLSAIFTFFSFYFYILYTEKKHRFLILGTFFSYVIALLSKETAMTLPVVIFAYEFFFRQESFWNKLKIPILLGALTIPFFALRLLYFKYTWESAPFSWRLFTAPVIITEYLKLLVYPDSLKLFYDFPIIKNIMNSKTIFAFILIIIIAILAIKISHKDRRVGFSILWILITLLPVSGIISFIYPAIMADRYMYIPSAGFSFAAGLAYFTLTKNGFPSSENSLLHKFQHLKNKIFPSLFILILIILSLYTIKKNFLWKDDLTFKMAMVNDAPLSPHTHNHLGTSYITAGKLDDAVREFHKALEINPDFSDAYNNLGLAYMQMKNYKYAVKELQKAVSLKPRQSNLWHNYGGALLYDGMYKEAETAFSTALQLNPDFAEAHNALGYLYLTQGKKDKAITHFKKAVELNPGNKIYRSYLDKAYQAR